jgi:hypothetical protein
LKARSKGGHARNTIINFIEGEYIEFRFSKPEGFNGTRELKIIETLEGYTEIIHVIRMQISIKATLYGFLLLVGCMMP